MLISKHKKYAQILSNNFNNFKIAQNVFFSPKTCTNDTQRDFLSPEHAQKIHKNIFSPAFGGRKAHYPEIISWQKNIYI